MSSESSAHDDHATMPKSSSTARVTVTEQTKHTYGERIMWSHSYLQPHCLAHALTRLRLALITGAALACTLCAGPTSAATAQPSPQTPQREQLTIPPEEAMKP